MHMCKWCGSEHKATDNDKRPENQTLECQTCRGQKLEQPEWENKSPWRHRESNIHLPNTQKGLCKTDVEKISGLGDPKCRDLGARLISSLRVFSLSKDTHSRCLCYVETCK